MELRIFTHQCGMTVEESVFENQCLLATVSGADVTGLADDYDLIEDGDYSEIPIDDYYILESYGIDVNSIDGDVYIYLND